MVERCVRDAEAASSNLVISTIKKRGRRKRPLFLMVEMLLVRNWFAKQTQVRIPRPKIDQLACQARERVSRSEAQLPCHPTIFKRHRKAVPFFVGRDALGEKLVCEANAHSFHHFVVPRLSSGAVNSALTSKEVRFCGSVLSRLLMSTGHQFTSAKPQRWRQQERSAVTLCS